MPEEYQPFWNGISQYLDWFDVLHWSERPLRLTGITSVLMTVRLPTSGARAYVCWCPDLIGEIGGVRVIADFKTSNAPYCANFPERGDRIGFGGFRKYTKCAQQMAAYRLALEERTGYHCDVALIIVSTPETAQAIFIDSDQLDLQEARFLKRCKQFHELDNEAEDSSKQELPEQGEPACA